MATTRKYYWLKLKRDFFKRHDVKIIEAMDNGKDYILFYLKLLLESIDHEGKLRFSETIPYDEKMLATITDTNIDTVRSACKVFASLGMMERFDDGTLFMTQVETMIGSETSDAQRMREARAKQKQLPAPQEQGEQRSDPFKNRSPELDTDTDKEREEEAPPATFGESAEIRKALIAAWPDHKLIPGFYGMIETSDDLKRLLAARIQKGITIEDALACLKNYGLAAAGKAGETWITRWLGPAKFFEGDFWTYFLPGRFPDSVKKDSGPKAPEPTGLAATAQRKIPVAPSPPPCTCGAIDNFKENLLHGEAKCLSCNRWYRYYEIEGRWIEEGENA